MRTSSPSERAEHGADGFTLPEVLITVVMMGLIVSVLAGVASVVLRNTPSTEARADDARSMMGLVTWLPQDVDSTPSTGFDQTKTKASGCGIDAGTNILHLTWTENLAGSKSTFIADYRHVPNGSKNSLRRITCSGTGSPPFSNGTSINLTGDLPALPASWMPGQAPVAVEIVRNTPTTVDLVKFKITTITGKVVSTDSASKNPAATLPSTTLPSWYLPTPTTGVFANTPPTASSPTIVAKPAPALTSVNLTVYDADGHSMIVELDSSTVPTGWMVNLASTTLTVSPVVADVDQTRIIRYTVDDSNGGVTAGLVTVNVISPTATTTTSTSTTTTTTTATTVPTPACAVTSASLSPSSEKNVPADGSNAQVSVGVLFKSIVATAATNGYCTGLLIKYSSGGTNTPGFVNMVRTGTTSWQVTIPGKDAGSSETWTDGPHPITFNNGPSTSLASATLTVT